MLSTEIASDNASLVRYAKRAAQPRMASDGSRRVRIARVSQQRAQDVRAAGTELAMDGGLRRAGRRYPGNPEPAGEIPSE